MAHKNNRVDRLVHTDLVPRRSDDVKSALARLDFEERILDGCNSFLG